MAGPGSATILYVDDDGDYRETYGMVFRQAGFDVREARTGNEALRLAAQHPDLVVLDVNLPDINGYEVCRRIKTHPATNAIPVLHLSTVFVRSAERTHSLEEGADAYLTKPVEPHELLAHVRALLRLHRAEEALREAARQWQATFDACSDGIGLVDSAGQVLRCNRAMAELIGLPLSAILGRPFYPLLQAALAPADLPDLTRIHSAGGRESIELSSGGRWFHLTADPVGSRDKITGSVHILADITAFKRVEQERTHLEATLLQAQKLEAVGRLAGGIAHDFNNLMAVVIGNTSMLLAPLPRDHPQREALHAVDQAAWRASELTRRLLGFSRQTRLWLKPVDLMQAVDEVVGLLRRTIDPRISVEVRRGSALWPVLADASQLNQVLMNLCLNARDAMPEGGRLLIQADNLELDKGQAARHAEARPGSFVRLRVVDTGQGIPADVLPHIFEPFFTTKEPGKGSGLGLAMVFGIVKQHQGWITCQTEVKRGTCFDIYLPRSEQPVPAAPVATTAPAPRGSETVLFVDDEPLVRNLAVKILRDRGYSVLHAQDGIEALELFRQRPQEIDLVVLDLTMPRLSGRDTLRRLREIDPAVRVLYASGYSAKAGDAGADEVLGFLAKPFRADDLALAVRTALDRVRVK
jgi:PAS domain S-box-containing protein